ncbi:MAG: hypothetical protein Q4A65_03260 [Bacillota bacterium]|nr:hypothetical protein [Bacillota bacterium]
MDTNTKTGEPRIDALTAAKMLEDIFDEAGASPNTMPASALAGYPDFQRQRFLPQRIVLIVILVLWLLIPAFFITPDYDIAQVSTNEQNLPVYTVEVDSVLPMKDVEAVLNGAKMPIYAKDSKTYAVEPDQNGRMEIRVTAVNNQVTVRSVDVNTVDDVGPKLISTSVEGSEVYLQMAENGTGVAYENIYAVGQTSGDIALPANYDRETGTIIFDLANEKWDVYIPDKRGNALHITVEIK